MLPLAQLGLGFLGLASCAHAAYVQWQPCPGIDAPTEAGLVFESLRLGLSPPSEDHGGRRDMNFSIFSMLGNEKKKCADVADDLSTVRVDLRMLGREMATFDATPNVTCSPPDAKHSPIRIAAKTNIGTLPPVSTFYLSFHLFETEQRGGGSNVEAGCLTAQITPAMSPSIRSALRYGPVALFLFFLVTSVARTFFGDTEPREDSDDGYERSSQSDQPHAKRPLLPGLGDCLHYLQFIFLSGSLSLRYPGFYQPVVSHLNWFSLFSSAGPINRSFQYPSVNDGIYQINGTYGGTLGFELMTQIVGATMTMDLWLNMVLLLAILAVLAAGIAGLVVNMPGSGNRRSYLWHLESAEHERTLAESVKFTTTHVFRAILSYFMLPLVALSTYQLDYAALFPAYHTALACGFLVLIAAAFAWLLWQIPTRSLGVLVFDNSKQYSRLDSDSPSVRSAETSFVLILFVLNFIRGVVIGGLQISSIAQLFLLIACELFLLVSIFSLQTYDVLSVGVGCTLVRLVVLSLMIVFLPGVASFRVKDSIGYGILCVHALVLFFFFFVPTGRHLWRLCIDRWNAERPEVYGLRQLQRRDVSNMNLSAVVVNSSSPATLGCPEIHLQPALRPGTPSTLNLDTTSLTGPSRFYRPPRSPSLHLSIDYGNSRGRPNPPSSPSTPESRNHRHRLSVSHTSESPTTTTTSESSQPSTSTFEAGPEDFRRVPLGPRWNDYSFREADLYYAQPPRRKATAPLGDGPDTDSLPTKLWRRLFSGGAGRNRPTVGFEVIRPGVSQSTVRLNGQSAT